jgi:serine/threonine protein kinase
VADFVSGLKIGARLGSGHFGEVFRGEDPAHGDVAVKILRREAYQDDATWPSYKADYLAEAKNLSKAAHRNVVPVYHVVEAPDGNSVVICMAFCPGGSLQNEFEKGPMTPSAVRKVGTEVLMGLATMHSRGMVHRDIKPANLLLNDRGEAQISDFGLVTDSLVLGYASQAGYSDHIAYEVWNGSGTSAKSDIWALGMTLYRLLHGKDWYEAQPIPRNVVPIGGFADTLRWLPHVPKPWRRVLRKMLHDDTAVRYQNAAQAVSGLAGVPIAPVWSTAVSNGLVRWEQQKGARCIRVEWKQHAPRKHEWRAWSEPLVSGKTRTLDGASGIVPGGQAVRELEAFFAR